MKKRLRLSPEHREELDRKRRARRIRYIEAMKSGEIMPRPSLEILAQPDPDDPLREDGKEIDS